MTAFSLQGWQWRVVMEIVWAAKLKIFSVWPFSEEVCWPLLSRKSTMKPAESWLILVKATHIQWVEFFHEWIFLKQKIPIEFGSFHVSANRRKSHETSVEGEHEALGSLTKRKQFGSIANQSVRTAPQVELGRKCDYFLSLWTGRLPSWRAVTSVWKINRNGCLTDHRNPFVKY